MLGSAFRSARRSSIRDCQCWWPRFSRWVFRRFSSGCFDFLRTFRRSGRPLGDVAQRFQMKRFSASSTSSQNLPDDVPIHVRHGGSRGHAFQRKDAKAQSRNASCPHLVFLRASASLRPCVKFSDVRCKRHLSNAHLPTPSPGPATRVSPSTRRDWQFRPQPTPSLPPNPCALNPPAAVARSLG